MRVLLTESVQPGARADRCESESLGFIVRAQTLADGPCVLIMHAS